MVSRRDPSEPQGMDTSVFFSSLSVLLFASRTARIMEVELAAKS